MVLVSTRIMGAAGTDGSVVVVPFASFVCSVAMLNAVEPQISQVLQNK